MKIIIFLSTFFFFTNAFAQDGTFFINDKTYPCTKEFVIGKSDYNCESFGKPTILFAKDGKKGLMVFKNGYSRICGTIILYLDDNTTIKLLDRKTFDYVDNEYSSIFYLTEAEILKLQKVNIRTIRYNISKDHDKPEAKTANNQDINCVEYEYKLTSYKRTNFPEVIGNLYR